MFWGLTPLIGLQTLAIVGTWFTSRRVLGKESSLLQAFVWAWVNNPVTIVPMYYLFYLTGLWLVGEAGRARDYRMFGELLTRDDMSWMERITFVARTFGQPLLIGCIPYASLGSALSYRWALGIVRVRRERLRRRRAEYETFRT